jgi:hypothetical protein
VLILQVLGAVELLARGRLVLLALELANFRFHFLHVDRSRRRRNLDARRGLIDEVDGLVGQEPTVI